MACGPKQRLNQLSEHLVVSCADHGRSEGIPKICQVAPDSTGKYVRQKKATIHVLIDPAF